jgi:hypothetical protein
MAVGWQQTSAPGDLQDPYSYGLFIDNGGGACAKVHGNVTVRSNIWIGGALCPDGGVAIDPLTAHQYSVYVGGDYQGGNNSSLGTSALPFATARILGNCTVQGKGATCSISSASNVFADAYPGTGSTLQKPTYDPAAIYNSGNWSSPSCSGSTSFVFDNDGTKDQSLGTTNLFRGASFDCTVTDSAGATVGRLAWDKSTSTLTIDGTIFIDGDVALSDSGSYAGNGTIYANGVIKGSGQVDICGPYTSSSASGYGCPHTWDPQVGNLGLVAINPSGAANGFNGPSGGEIDATVIAAGAYVNSGNAVVLGPVIADGADIGGSTAAIIPASPPKGSPPSDNSSDGGWRLQAGSWKQTG